MPGKKLPGSPSGRNLFPGPACRAWALLCRPLTNEHWDIQRGRCTGCLRKMAGNSCPESRLRLCAWIQEERDFLRFRPRRPQQAGSHAQAGRRAQGSNAAGFDQDQFCPGRIAPHRGRSTTLPSKATVSFKSNAANGELGYTRNGQFQLKGDRTLITQQGLTVMGESGPITFRPGVRAGFNQLARECFSKAINRSLSCSSSVQRSAKAASSRRRPDGATEQG